MADEEKVDQSNMDVDESKAAPPAEEKAEEKVEEKAEEKTEEKSEEKAEEPPKGAPEKYEAFEVEEGFELSEEVNTAFVEVAKKNGVTQEGAQELVKLYTDLQKATKAAVAKADQDRRSDWEAEAKKHEEIGGSKFDENMSFALKARDKFFPKEINKFLDETGLGNHPDLLVGFYRIGKAISDDTFVQEKPGGTDDSFKTDGELLYGKKK